MQDMGMVQYKGNIFFSTHTKKGFIEMFLYNATELMKTSLTSL